MSSRCRTCHDSTDGVPPSSLLKEVYASTLRLTSSALHMAFTVLCPAQVKDTGGAEAEAAQARRVRERLAARAEQEEDQMTRVPLSKDERKRMKAARRADLAGGAMLDDFADDVAHLVKVLHTLACMPPACDVKQGMMPGQGMQMRVYIYACLLGMRCRCASKLTYLHLSVDSSSNQIHVQKNHVQMSAPL